jgi:hypothetical protein
VIGSGVTHSVREFVETTFVKLGMDWTQHVGIVDENGARLDPPRRYRQAASPDRLAAAGVF